MFAESESDVVAELEMNCNLEKTMVSTYPARRCPHQRLQLARAEVLTPVAAARVGGDGSRGWSCPGRWL